MNGEEKGEWNGEEKVYNLNRANMFLHYMTFSERESFLFLFFSFPSKELLIPIFQCSFDLLNRCLKVRVFLFHETEK